jgi:superfamily II DNA or RNA helicase
MTALVPVNDYTAFLERKQPIVPSSGIDVDDEDIHESLFPFQRDLVRWALRKGRSAIFATTGMGKTRMQLEWARLTGLPTLLVAPLAVAQQTVREAEALGIDLVYARSQDGAGPLTITNYEMVSKFDARQFGAVVLDESSILKAHDGKTRTALIEQFARTPYRLCCTATPAPNDTAELANHAEFLGILSRVEMLAMFFVHDDEGWRLKGHAREPFYRWLASWGMSLQKPSDLGYDDGAYLLPPLSIEPMILPTNYVPAGQLFATSLKGITDRAAVRKSTVGTRTRAAAEWINADNGEPWIAWCGLNDEARELTKLIPDAVNVEGSMAPDAKADALLRFAAGEIRVLVSKPSIAGFGMNFQHCARMVFVGLGDSYEQYFQAIRRCWRFGQTRPVKAVIVLTEPEEAIYANVLRKEREAQAMADELVKHVAHYERAEIGHAAQTVAYEPAVPMVLPQWLECAA